MKEVLLVLACLIGLLAMIIAPIYGAVKYQIYKSTKYYKLLTSDFDLKATDDPSNYFGAEGVYKDCTIKVYNDNSISGNKKMLYTKLRVHHSQLRVMNSSIKQIKNTVLAGHNVSVENFHDYFEIKLPTNYELDNQLKKQFIDTAIILGFEDNLEVVQDENKAFNAVISFTMDTKNRYAKCKALIMLLTNLNAFLVLKQCITLDKSN